MLCWIALLLLPMPAEDWPQFRGQNGSGISTSTKVPNQFGPAKNVVWKTALPFGHSSPVISGDRIFLTGAEGGSRADAGREKVVDAGGRLFTFALDRVTGKILWRKEGPRPRLERYQPTNSSASPSPATDGENVYVFFGDYGLLAYTRDGKESFIVYDEVRRGYVGGAFKIGHEKKRYERNENLEYVSEML
ncbi:MAG: PQQ-binding-like beta-propeller repeat protein, partial [Candidatus Solibacter usitatus]|nr:PQQ-binding-like beta-propeller repeat protein [Candidatus Solibacter usitatus]